MPIPAFTANEVLPLGVHDCTLTELKQRFGVFRGTERRVTLFAKLETFLIQVWQSGTVEAIIVNGSFVTEVEAPGDIDMILQLRADHDFTADLSPVVYNLLSKNRVRRTFGFDVFAATEQSGAFAEYLRFFQQVKGRPGLNKGVLRLSA